MEDLVGNPDLADVVKERRGADAADLLAAERQRLAHPRGQVDDALRMVARVAVALLERRGERRDHVAMPELEHGVAVLRGATEDHGLPATAGARLLQSRPRRGKHGLGLLSDLQRRDADRGRDAADPARLEVLELDQYPLDRAPRRGGGGLGQQEPELVAAHPAGEVVNAGLLGDQATDGDQHRVAGRVAALEVQLAKPVDVEQGHRQRALVALGARDVELELGPEGAEAEQARDQRIPLGEPGQLLFELADPLPSSRELARTGAFVPPHAHQADYRLCW